MPVVRRCPKCGDDLGLDEAVCVFCGHPIGRASARERLRRRGEDWLMPLALVVVTWLAGVPLVFALAGPVAPGLVESIRGTAGAEWALRAALVLGMLAVIAARVVLRRRG